jgi:hypothetical protein
MRLTAIFATILVTTTAVVVAQEQAAPLLTPRQPSTEGSVAMPQAPIGHRQPRASDLPPDVARREQGGEQPRPSERPSPTQRSGIDPQLRICRPC